MRLLFLISTLLLCFQATGQIVEKPLPNLNTKPTPKGTGEIAYAAADAQSEKDTEPKGLPFWDDFSQALVTPSAQKWVNGQHVRISNGTGIKAPTLNAALFDGIDAKGKPYNPRSLLNGPTDSLTSRRIDLFNGLDRVAQADSVFLSFFWQAKGAGELPDSEDSLILQFKNADEQWVTQWRTVGGKDNETGAFTQKLIQVPPPYFHDAFQFRFRSFSRLAGAFDTWLIDYVYLNKGRHANDTAYPDRALTRKPSFLIGPYTAMPTEQFFADPKAYVKETTAAFFNLNNAFQPVQYSAIVRNVVTKEVVQTLNDKTVASPLPQAFERLTFTSPALNPGLLDASADSTILETTYYIKSGDNFFIDEIKPGNDTVFVKAIDYRINDTVRVETRLDDYFAYDDGEPDFAAGINQAGGKLAYRFVLEKRALLTHIDINFAFVQQTGKPVKLTVWQGIKVGTNKGSVLFQESFSVKKPDFIGQLHGYPLKKPIYVQDTIYIGFSQATNEFLAVGLDKNTDSGKHLFFNVDGKWRANELVKGSLLMRPRFDKKIAKSFAGSDKPGVTARLSLYPNPSSGIIHIRGGLDHVEVFNSFGKQVRFRLKEEEEGYVLNLNPNKKGIYLLRITKGGQTITRRIILKD